MLSKNWPLDFWNYLKHWDIQGQWMAGYFWMHRIFLNIHILLLVLSPGEFNPTLRYLKRAWSTCNSQKLSAKKLIFLWSGKTLMWMEIGIELHQVLLYLRWGFIAEELKGYVEIDLLSLFYKLPSSDLCNGKSFNPTTLTYKVINLFMKIVSVFRTQRVGYSFLARYWS